MQTIQFRVDNNYIDIVVNLLNSLNSLKLNVIKYLSITKSNNESSNEDFQELNAYSHHMHGDERDYEIWREVKGKQKEVLEMERNFKND